MNVHESCDLLKENILYIDELDGLHTEKVPFKKKSKAIWIPLLSVNPGYSMSTLKR